MVRASERETLKTTRSRVNRFTRNDARTPQAAPNPLSMTHFPNAFQMRRCEEREGARGKGFVVRNVPVPYRLSVIVERWGFCRT